VVTERLLDPGVVVSRFSRCCGSTLGLWNLPWCSRNRNLGLAEIQTEQCGWVESMKRLLIFLIVLVNAAFAQICMAESQPQADSA
jgi:hypothetical protein